LVREHVAIFGSDPVRGLTRLVDRGETVRMDRGSDDDRHASEPSSTMKGTRGSVLVLVVWAVALLSLLAVALASRSTFLLGVTDRMTERLQASYIAMAGVQHALKVVARDATLHYDGLSEEWADSMTLFADQPFGAGTFTVYADGAGAGGAPAADGAEAPPEVFGLIDEERKLNLNTASPEMLQRLFRAAGGLEEEAATDMSDVVVDWRDEDQDDRPGGAEDFYYMGLTTSYDCKDAPFESVEELWLLKGMTPKLFERAAPLVTVYGSGAVNINTASEEVLQALGLGAESARGMFWYCSGEDGAPGTDDDRMLTSTAAVSGDLSALMSAEDIALLQRLGQDRLAAVGSSVFSFRVVARVGEGEAANQSRTQVRCVAERSGRILTWREW